MAEFIYSGRAVELDSVSIFEVATAGNDAKDEKKSPRDSGDEHLGESLATASAVVIDPGFSLEQEDPNGLDDAPNGGPPGIQNATRDERQRERQRERPRQTLSNESLGEGYERPPASRSRRAERSQWLSGTTLSSREDGEPEERPRAPRSERARPRRQEVPEESRRARFEPPRADEGFEGPPPDRPGRRRKERTAETLAGRRDGGRPPRHTDGSRLIVSVDYGTTYSGVGYAAVSSDEYSLDDIDVIRAWGPKMSNAPKVPSVISYTPGVEQQWGKDLSSDAIALLHTKLQLDIDSVSGELDFILQALDGMKNLHFAGMVSDGGLPSYTEKDPEHIVQDYLTKFFTGGLASLRRSKVEEFSQTSLDNNPTDIVITHPSTWSYKAKNSTYRAVTRAGFNRRSFPALKDVMMISEPEAAAVYTARYMSEVKQEDFLESQDYFVLCDAGGGTVDVVSYKVLQVKPSLQLERVGLPAGSKCGSSFINLEFKRWLRRILRDENYRKLDPNIKFRNLSSHLVESEAMRRLMDDFNTHKEHFGPDSDDILIWLPAPLDGLHMPPVVNRGQLKIPRDIMKEFFGRCIGGIIRLITGQLFQIGERHGDAKHIFLVGGFAESEYLQVAIHESLERRKRVLWRPETSQTAVARGAVICGIEKLSSSNLATIAYPCLRSYGIVVDRAFSEVTCSPKDMARHTATNQTIATAQMHWLISKGDLVLPNEPRIRHEFTTVVKEGADATGEVKIWSCEEDEEYRPDRFYQYRHKYKEASVLQYDMSRFSPEQFGRRYTGLDGIPYRIAQLTMVVGFKDGEMRAAIKFKGETLVFNPIPYYLE